MRSFCSQNKRSFPRICSEVFPADVTACNLPLNRFEAVRSKLFVKPFAFANIFPLYPDGYRTGRIYAFIWRLPECSEKHVMRLELKGDTRVTLHQVRRQEKGPMSAREFLGVGYVDAAILLISLHNIVRKQVTPTLKLTVTWNFPKQSNPNEGSKSDAKNRRWFQWDDERLWLPIAGWPATSDSH